MAVANPRKLFVNIVVRDLKVHDLDGHHWEVVWMDPKAVA